MAVDLNTIPTSNTLPYRISLLNNAGGIVATLDAGEAKVLECRVYALMAVNPPNPPVVRNQYTPGNFEAHPGNVAFIEGAGPGNGLNLSFGMPTQHQTTVNYR